MRRAARAWLAALPLFLTRAWLAALGTVAFVVLSLVAVAPATAYARTGAATLNVQSVPRVAGARIVVDGVTHLTNARGFAAIPSTVGVHQVSVLPPVSEPPGTRVKFFRWLDPQIMKRHSLLLHSGTNHEQASFIVSRPVSISVKGPTGQKVPLDRISSIVMTSSIGQRLTFAAHSPLARLATNRIARKGDRLVSLPIRYALQAVMMDGSNVVHLGGQAFYVRSSGRTRWVVQALVFPLRVEVHDALFGFATGESVKLVLPDNSTRIVDLGSGHATTLVALPRGLYTLVPKGPGIGLTSPTALSKPQGARLLLLSWLDIGVVLGFAVAFLAGLPLLGGRLVRRGRRPEWRMAHGELAPAAEESAAAVSGESDAVVAADAPPGEAVRDEVASVVAMPDGDDEGDLPPDARTTGRLPHVPVDDEARRTA
jgi:hypothetical protein